MPASVPLPLMRTSATPRYAAPPMLTRPLDDVSTTGPLLTACCVPALTRYWVMPEVMVTSFQNESAPANPAVMSWLRYVLRTAKLALEAKSPMYSRVHAGITSVSVGWPAASAAACCAAMALADPHATCRR